MAVVTSTRSTLDIKFHIQDGTVAGDYYTWKLNFPQGGTSSTLTLNDVKAAFGFESNPKVTLKYYVDTFGNPTDTRLIDKDGNIIDGIDAAAIVTTTTTKNELS